VPLSGLRKILVPLPPLAEQCGFGAKVDELMELCDRLESRLTGIEAQSEAVLEAIIRAALNDTVESASRTNSRSHRPELLASGIPEDQ
jgi:type I restriction enzyme S subunit